MCLLGTFSPYTVCRETSIVKIKDDLPLDKAALLGCGVTTGWGTAVYAADVSPGDTVVVLGIGGVGANAVQGARIAGATQIIAVDPSPLQREQAKRFGATHTFASAQDARAALPDLTRGRLANAALVTVDVVTGAILGEAISLVGKLGTVALASLGSVTDNQVVMSMFEARHRPRLTRAATVEDVADRRGRRGNRLIRQGLPGWRARPAPAPTACRCGGLRGGRPRRRPRSAPPGRSRWCRPRRFP